MVKEKGSIPVLAALWRATGETAQVSASANDMGHNILGLMAGHGNFSIDEVTEGVTYLLGKWIDGFLYSVSHSALSGIQQHTCGRGRAA